VRHSVVAEGQIDNHHLNSCVLGKELGSQIVCQSPKQPLKCPQCGCTRLYKDGLRYKPDGSQTQRWLCRDCYYRFSQRSLPIGVKDRILPNSGKVLKNSKVYSVECRDRDEFRGERAFNLLAEGLTLANSTNPTENAQREGTLEKTQTNDKNDNASKIVAYLWSLKQDGVKDNTIDRYGSYMQKLSKHTNLIPENVKDYLCKDTDWNDATKQTVTAIYNGFLKFSGISWKQPKYRAADRLPFIPTEADIDALIAGCGRILALFLQVLKETGARSGEAAQLKWTDIDFERKIISINSPGKNSKARILPISNKLVAILNSKVRRSEKVFPAKGSLLSNYTKTRKALVSKLQNPRFKQITFHTFRHWKATTEYHKTKDIIHVQQLLGHRDIKNTMIYINIESALYLNTDAEYTGKIATTDEEILALIDVGFEYVTDMTGGRKLFRKRK